jgi:arsenite methyltransferase
MRRPACLDAGSGKGERVHEIVRDYYGTQLAGTLDLKTSACCDASAVPSWLTPMLGRIHPAVLARYYGCGMVCPPLLEGAKVLDLGCGSGRDVYLLAQLVGASGQVIGVDMTEEQLAVAQDHRDHHAEQFGFANVSFELGDIERLDELGLQPESFDVIISNCVINLSSDKEAVLRGAHRLLKGGGELYFADVYADRRVPSGPAEDPLLYGECLGGALYWNDFLRTAAGAGFTDPRLVEDRPIAINDSELAARAGNIGFHSATYRLFKLTGLETACEDYGQAVTYRGTVPACPDRFLLDKHHAFETGRTVAACGNTWRMLKETRFEPHFDFIGDFSRHYGIFEGCGVSIPFGGEEPSPSCC